MHARRAPECEFDISDPRKGPSPLRFVFDNAQRGRRNRQALLTCILRSGSFVRPTSVAGTSMHLVATDY